MNKFKLAYFGTPQFSAVFLEKIILDKELPIEIVFVVTQPDKKVGRKQILTPSPVKLIAQKYEVPIFYSIKTERVSRVGGPRHARSETSTGGGINERRVLPLSNIDLALLFAYGKIIPKEILEIPKFGFWNVHLSLLPKYRGATPTAFPLIMGETETGVTLMQMDEALDHGPIIAQEEISISQNDKRPDLEKKLTDLAFKIFKSIISTLIQNPLLFDSNTHRSKNKILEQQNHSLATFTRLLHKDDGFIPFTILQKALKNEPFTPDELPIIIKDYFQKSRLNLSTIIYNLFRGLYPWPGLWTMVKIGNQQKRLKITDLSYSSSEAELNLAKSRRLNNSVLDSTPLRSNNKLLIRKVQLEGKKEVDFNTFQEAYKVFIF